MRIARVFYLLFRYVTLTFVGASLAFLWRHCQLDQYESLGRFYAIWVPLIYAFFSTGYVAVAECVGYKRPLTETSRKLYHILDRFRHYDDYTYLALVWIAGLEIAGTAMTAVYPWLAISYLALIVLKGGIFLTAVYHLICKAPIIRQPASESVPAPVSLPLQGVLVMAAVIIYSLLSGYHLTTATTTGDEPHYLLITHSLWHDHDTNLYNNYRDHDYTAFYWYDLEPTWGDQVSETEIYSYRHKGGFPHTLIPGYVLGGRPGAVVQTNIITALLMLQVFLLAYALVQSLKAAFFTWACMAFSIPLIVYMGQIYPETLAALLTLWAARWIWLLHPWEEGENSAVGVEWSKIAYSVPAILLLVVLKARYLPIAGTLFLFLLFQVIRRRVTVTHKIRLAVGLAGLILAGAVAIWLADTYLLGRMLRDRITDTGYMAWMLGGYNPLFGFLGLLFDQEYGLLVYTPLYAFALVGVGLLTRREFAKTWSLLGIFLVNYGIISAWPLWHAAPTPPCRYILPVLPLLGVFLARFFVQAYTRAIHAVALGLAGVWSFLTAWIITINPGWRYNWADGTNNFLEFFSPRLALHLPRMLPSWTRPSPQTPYLTLLGIIVIGLLIYLGRTVHRKQEAPPRPAPIEWAILAVILAALVLMLSGIVVGKKLPIWVLEAEDRLDMQPHGGERVPASLDPWDNQLYLRRWRYFGWQLGPGDSLEAHPRLSPGKVTLDIYARAEAADESESGAWPTLQVVLNETVVATTSITSTSWTSYPVSILSPGRRPHIEFKHAASDQTQRAVILDKVRLR